jgi:hypothetical protein
LHKRLAHPGIVAPSDIGCNIHQPTIPALYWLGKNAAEDPAAV